MGTSPTEPDYASSPRGKHFFFFFCYHLSGVPPCNPGSPTGRHWLAVGGEASPPQEPLPEMTPVLQAGLGNGHLSLHPSKPGQRPCLPASAPASFSRSQRDQQSIGHSLYCGDSIYCPNLCNIPAGRIRTFPGYTCYKTGGQRDKGRNDDTWRAC